MVTVGKSRATASAKAMPSMIGMRMSVSKRSKRPSSRVSTSTASLPWRVTKRTSTSRPYGGGDASRLRNPTASPPGRLGRGGTAVQE